MQRLPAAAQRQQLLAEVDERGQGAVKVPVLVEEVAALGAQTTKPAAEHVLPEDEVRAVGAPSAVEALLGAVIEAGDPHGGQLHGHHVERQVAEPNVAAEARLRATLADLIVVVHQGNHLVAIPAVPGRRIQNPVAEYGEIIHWVGVSRDHAFELARDVLDSQGGIQAGPLYYPPGVVAARSEEHTSELQS